ncbi:MAG: hypothetical protein GTO18_17005 [Anaerolineales bacterium]|nr:hypothetical protein [Anaerolineales bacterium]
MVESKGSISPPSLMRQKKAASLRSAIIALSADKAGFGSNPAGEGLSSSPVSPWEAVHEALVPVLRIYIESGSTNKIKGYECVIC